MRGVDLLGSAWRGLQSRWLRTLLTASGIAVGIASLVAVFGITQTGRAAVLAVLEDHGANLLTVRAQDSLAGQQAQLHEHAAPMIRRIEPVQAAAATRVVSGESVRRTPTVPTIETRGISVVAAEPTLLATVGGELAWGRFLDQALERYPAVVLGSTAAERLGIRRDQVPTRVHIGETWFSVVGVVEPLPLAADLDTAALIGFPVAGEVFGLKGAPETVRVRAHPAHREEVAGVLGPTGSPESPSDVEVRRPADLIEAQAETDRTLTGLMLGLGGVALLVGAIGIANVMVFSVLERRREIGVRRAMGAARGHIRWQFLVEAMLLGGVGGLAGTVLGTGVSVAYALAAGLPLRFPLQAAAFGPVLAVVVGVVAGLYPAGRAARLDPAEAVRPW